MIPWASGKTRLASRSRSYPAEAVDSEAASSLSASSCAAIASSFSIFTSRPTPFVELQERLTLSDSTATEYVMQPSATEIIDGKGVIEFTPGPPTEATALTFGEPGRWLTLYAVTHSDPK
jgi:hypothetical protein